MNDGNLAPMSFELANQKMVAPGCGDLPVFYGDGHFISCWSLTAEQIEMIAETKRLWLGIRGEQHPAVWISLDYPFIHNNDEWPEGLEETK